mmetsp:Transcript_2491/g.6274  ORF Transcript_2491/g.6274 Transcript_2491/m.6274 type:complete len:471 (+) Transcript_2491:170-1582(+)
MTILRILQRPSNGFGDHFFFGRGRVVLIIVAVVVVGPCIVAVVVRSVVGLCPGRHEIWKGRIRRSRRRRRSIGGWRHKIGKRTATATLLGRRRRHGLLELRLQGGILHHLPHLFRHLWIVGELIDHLLHFRSKPGIVPHHLLDHGIPHHILQGRRIGHEIGRHGLHGRIIHAGHARAAHGRHSDGAAVAVAAAHQGRQTILMDGWCRRRRLRLLHRLLNGTLRFEQSRPGLRIRFQQINALAMVRRSADKSHGRHDGIATPGNVPQSFSKRGILFLDAAVLRLEGMLNDIVQNLLQRRHGRGKDGRRIQLTQAMEDGSQVVIIVVVAAWSGGSVASTCGRCHGGTRGRAAAGRGRRRRRCGCRRIGRRRCCPCRFAHAMQDTVGFQFEFVHRRFGSVVGNQAAAKNEFQRSEGNARRLARLHSQIGTRDRRVNGQWYAFTGLGRHGQLDLDRRRVVVVAAAAAHGVVVVC